MPMPKSLPLAMLRLACCLPSFFVPAWVSAAEASPQDAEPTCIEVEVNGERAPSYACLSQRLRPSASNDPRRDVTPASEAIVQRPGNALGVFNRAATANRMGNTFGTSVHPQRPPVVAPVLPFGPRVP